MRNHTQVPADDLRPQAAELHDSRCCSERTLVLLCLSSLLCLMALLTNLWMLWDNQFLLVTS